MNLSIALAQLEVVTGDFQYNTSRAGDYITRAAQAGSDLIVFPELWTAGFDYSDCQSYALDNRAYLEVLQKTADEMKIAIGGSYLIEDEGRFYNQFVLIQPGLHRLSYNKIHLFRLMEEDVHLTPGSRVSFEQTKWGPISLSVCYDLRFPEMFRLTREKGVRLMIMAAGWPLKRVEHWKTLLRARAIENQVYFAAVNCVAGDVKTTFGGASAVINPWGVVVREAGSDKEELVLVEIDLDEVDRVRKMYPFFEDRLTDYSV